MPQLPDSLRTFLDTLRGIDASGAIDILLIALLIYAVLLWLKGTTGMSVIKGAGIVIVAGLATRRNRRSSERLLATLAQAAVELSSLGLGALIVIERETGLDEYIPSG